MNEMNRQPRKRFLVLDTATAAQAVAVMEEDRVLAAHSSDADRNHSVGLMSSITTLLEQTGTARQQLDGIAVGIGPGSYTGIRIAVTTAKTLAWALKLPVAGFSSLAALALSGYHAGSAAAGSDTVQTLDDTKQQDTFAMTATTLDWIIPLIDARRAQVYTGLFRMSASEQLPQQMQDDRIILMEEWMQRIGEYYESLPDDQRPQRILIVGETTNHIERAEQLRTIVGERLYVRCCVLEAQQAGQVGAARLLAGQHDPVHTLLPNYTQLSEAEANLLRHS
ncbi:tRNA (adenosine(37)-N6)-threonylcarbamoyltransferase complex dimerization subunit type 1 TsaB [Paenibacillus wulumuqiensis]|uniref:tRNA (adenosine(37)-N6)-threonylcarbamoyltransferase complex dimerization subunit type 1 TsaB n=1 Tax=Paenibacillus wulumuqiensis TaxID=1567107 RepID=UPI000619F15D|nr:tRNA (adenosine(37)-N6)-threonylcarbamoyltransferase complex dimerization subunit type 1 TsaB [Paenibacillus wulumuqiensis]